MDRRQVYSISLKLLTLLGVTVIMAVMINSLFPVEDEDKKAQPSVVKQPETQEVNLADLFPGKIQFTQWNGKPVAILRRAEAPSGFVADTSDTKKDVPLLDPQWRSARPEYFVFYNAAGAAQCPLYLVPGGTRLKDTCSGVVYDTSGRRVKGQGEALRIPPHYFLDEKHLLIGKWHLAKDLESR